MPSMWLLIIKNDKYRKPFRAKSHIIVMGNFKYRLYHKPQRYATVLKYISLRILTSRAVYNRLILQQGDLKNAFWNAKIPYYEVTVIHPQLTTHIFRMTNIGSSRRLSME